jgi:hypothetical protein
LLAIFCVADARPGVAGVLDIKQISLTVADLGRTESYYL